VNFSVNVNPDGSFVRYGKGKWMLEKPVQGTAVPSDVNVINMTRVGNKEREGTIRHILDCVEDGSLKPDEGARRIAHASKAEHGIQLRNLTSDLPSRVSKGSYWQRRNFKRLEYFGPAYAGGLFASLCLGIVPGMVVDQINDLNSSWGKATFGITLILGIVGFFVSVIGFIIAMCERVQ